MKIKTTDLTVSYGSKEVLAGISAQIEKGKITAIVGQSGCGKSTFLKSLNRIVEEEGGTIKGKIFLDEMDIFQMDKETLRKKVGLVFQHPVVFPYSIEKNLAYVLQYHFQLSKEELKERIEQCLKAARLFDEVKDCLSMPAGKLSGGQKQRLSIARSLCVEPKVLLLDEPCSALDMKNTIAIEEMLLELRGKYTIAIVTHNLAQAQRMADSVLFMDQGNVVEESDQESFFREPKSQLAKEYIRYMQARNERHGMTAACSQEKLKRK